MPLDTETLIVVAIFGLFLGIFLFYTLVACMYDFVTGIYALWQKKGVRKED